MNSRPAFLTAEWRMLAMLNYQVEPGLLRPLVPRGVELDSWDNKVFISLVGFRFLNTKLLGVPIPFHRDFEEANLRFYVRREEHGVVKRGVVFIREIVPKRAIAYVARAVYNEPYLALPMTHSIERAGEEAPRVRYSWSGGRGVCRVAIAASGAPALPCDGSEQQFITEHYWGYCAQRDGGCVEYEVAHPPWLIWSSREATFEGDVKGLYEPAFAEVLRHPPASAFLAEGSAVTVYRARRI